MTLKEDLLAKIKTNKERNEVILASIPEQYRVYVQMLERNAQVSKTELDLDKTLKDNGVFLYKNATYMKTTTVYLTVAGRIAMMTDYAENKGMELIIPPAEFLTVNGEHYCQKTVTLSKDGKVIKQSSGLAAVGFGGTGVDKTNPLENSETSALGRAIGFMGIGQSEWIATSDEVADAQTKQKQDKTAENGQTKQKQDKSAEKPVDKTNSVTNQPLEGPVYEVLEVTPMGAGGKMITVSYETGEQVVFWYTKDDWGKLTVVEGDVITGTPKECQGAKRSFTSLTDIQKFVA